MFEGLIFDFAFHHHQDYQISVRTWVEYFYRRFLHVVGSSCVLLSVDEYVVLIAALMAADMDDKETVTILLLGDPGCGKSTFLS